jgi:hypothetical protein
VFEGETLDVGGTRFGDPQPVQADQHREHAVGTGHAAMAWTKDATGA